ncbi:cyclic nucleotide-binding protein [Parapedobacter pyrenivorans]|uniref:Cyclic nucleotide-binding protein n=1 Tax=Parapedobacter pyrenivorans TaxID=1305674 RepID=A0A917HI19_9SPHI|nr:Crp/Fnr family transcriptional regulator [Parapedobacter pyrenivorans]GGG79685.1 cyclic nucleotide-binding protein [Parapedobacter pyrenivorans]
MNELAKEYLRKFDRFKSDDIDQIIANTSVETFKKGDSPVREGKICDKCYFILKGCLRQLKIVNGEERTMNFFTEGDPIVLYASYLNGKPADCTIQCIEDSILISGTKAQEIAMHRANPSTEHLMASLMFEDYKKAENYITLLNGFSPEERYLLLMKSRPGILNRIPLVYISSYLGITPESLSRIRRRIVTSPEKE